MRSQKQKNSKLSKRDFEKALDIIRLLLMLLILILLIRFTVVHAEETTYFDSEIDYWNEPKEKQPEKSPIKSPRNSHRKKVNQKLNKTLPINNNSANNKSTDNNYTSDNHVKPEYPERFLKTQADENYTIWLNYINKRDQLLIRMKAGLEKYLEDNKSKINNKAKALFKEEINRLAARKSINTKRYKFWFYFSSNCPECKRMFGTLRKLRQLGYYVEARLISNKKNLRIKLPFPFIRANKDELKKYNIKSVPILLINDLNKKAIFTLTGYQTVKTIIRQIGQIKT